MAAPFWQAGNFYLPGDLVQPVTAPAPNNPQVTNGGFAGATGWTFSGSAAYTASGGYGGGGCVQLPGNQPDGVALNNAQLAVPVGATMTATAMIQQGASVAGATAGWAEVRWYSATNVELSIDKGNVVDSGSGGAWHQSKVDAVCPAGAAYARAAIHLTSVADHNHAIFGDNLSVSGASAGLPEGLVYRAVQPESGTSGANEPAWPGILGLQVVDNDVIWEAVTTSRITWTASPRYVSGATEPTWPTDIGSMVQDGTINWEAVSRRVEDERCPNSKVVAIVASKVFAVDKDIVKFCATANPLDWSTADDAGYLPTGLQQANSNDMAVLQQYRANLVALNASSFQNWQVDPDPAAMAILDQMDGIGSVWPKAAVPVSNDMFYLSQLGVRTVGIANAAENLSAGDVGAPIDSLVQGAIRAAGANGSKVLATYFPGAGQYWLAVGDYPVSALSLSGDLPDGTVSDQGEYSYVASGGVMPYQFSIVSGELPSGADLSDDGRVTYEYTDPGEFSWTVRVIDAAGVFADLDDTARIGPQPVFGALSTGTAIVAGPDSTTFTTTIQTGISGALVDSRGGKLFHIGSGAGVVSSDGGATFIPCTGIPSGAPAAVVYSGGVWFYFNYGVTTQLGYRSSNGIDFVPFVLHPSARSWFCAVASGRMIMVGSEGVIRRSLDGGAQWSTVNVSGLGLVRAIAGTNGNFIAIDGNLNRGTFRRSTDNGATWSGVPSPYPALTPASVACRGRLFVVIFTGGQTCYSEDAGATWTQGGFAGNSLNTIGPANELVTAGVFLAASSNLGPSPAVLAYSSADGKTWQPMFTGSSTSLLSSITPLRGGQ